MHDEIWAIPADRITAFFQNRIAEVTIIPLENRRLGSLSFPQTRVMITGENAEEVHREFVLNFLSAGG
ncbi:MAG: hypothetical protein IJV40_05780 [Oscillospiraceae bacterium]|nr:hypothetical protein [Oscillospiraceae bacterium]